MKIMESWPLLILALVPFLACSNERSCGGRPEDVVVTPQVELYNERLQKRRFVARGETTLPFPCPADRVCI